MSALHSALVWATQRNVALQVVLFAREMWRARRIAPQTGAIEVVVHFPAWSRSLRAGDFEGLADQPWIPYEARAFLDRILTPQMRVFEFGAGSSTLYFAPRVREGFSVDHNAEWVARVKRVLADAALAHWQVQFVAPVADSSARNAADPAQYASDDPAWLAHSFRDYALTIDRHPDASFDLVLVDGRARVACSRHAISKVKPGGWFVLDNAERPGYAWVHAKLAQLGWESTSFYGPAPNTFVFSQTTLWQRPVRSERDPGAARDTNAGTSEGA